MGSKHRRLKAAAVAAVLAVSGFLAASAVLAQAQQFGMKPQRMMGQRGPAGMLPLELRRLDLSESQRQQIRALTEEHRQQVEGVRKQVLEQRLALNQAARAEVFDEQAVRNHAMAVAQTEAELAVARAQLQHRIFQQVLTPEQRQRAQEAREQLRQRMGERRERMEQWQPMRRWR
jgi:Spy/CpxP family protein refolding chaperone